LQDLWVNFDKITEYEDESLFQLKPKAIMPYEFDDNVQLDITIEMDFAQILLTRNFYTVLDFMSDIGGVT
jgi:hypothetical protein